MMSYSKSNTAGKRSGTDGNVKYPIVLINDSSVVPKYSDKNNFIRFNVIYFYSSQCNMFGRTGPVGVK